MQGLYTVEEVRPVPWEGVVVLAVLVVLIAVAIVNTRRRGRTDPAVAEHAAAVRSETVFRRILVPSFGSPPSDRAVSLACKIARPDKATVEVLYVVEVPMSLPADAEMPEEATRATQTLSRSEMIGRTFGVEVQGMVAKSRFAGKAIVEAATNQGADLIVLASAVRRHGDWGRTSEYVLRNAPCEVVIERAGRP